MGLLLRVWRRWRWPISAIAVLFAVYVGSYAILYRRGVAEAKAVGLDYFFYVPVADIARERARPGNTNFSARFTRR